MTEIEPTPNADDGWSATLGDLPPGHQERAERVRSHLVAVRGGSPFLSPTDADLLMSWLDARVPVARILAAVEQTAERRRKQRARLPMALANAAGLVARGDAARAPQAAPESILLAHDGPAHPLEPLVATLVGGPYAALGPALLALDPSVPDELAERAILIVADAYEAAWQRMDEVARDALLHAAQAGLADVLHLFDEATLETVLHEHARGLLRERTPHLSATAILRLVCP